MRDVATGSDCAICMKRFKSSYEYGGAPDNALSHPAGAPAAPLNHRRTLPAIWRRTGGAMPAQGQRGQDGLQDRSASQRDPDTCRSEVEDAIPRGAASAQFPRSE